MISKETAEHYVREEICDGRKQCAEDGDSFIRCHLKTPVVMFSPRQCNRWAASFDPERMSQQTQYKIRSLIAADQSLLWEMLYLSLFVPEGNAPFERSVLEHSDIAKYVRDWGRADDFGFVAARENNQPLGAVWLRLLKGDEKGYGYVDDSTPELGMAVFPEHRGQGIGTALLTRLVEAATRSYEQISLSVAAENPALRLYERLGFEVVAEVGTSLTMRRKLKARE